jgi:hypothetical protein
MRRVAPLLLALAALLAMSTSPAEAAKRRVPFGFFGTVLAPEMADIGKVSDAALDQQMALMARSGVESVRVVFAWGDLEPARGVYSFGLLDRVVAAAARHRLSVLANMTATPQWISPLPNDPGAFRLPPTDPTAIAELSRELVLRYGPTGTLWAQDPSLPRVPVRQWQIWNEQTAPWHWESRSWARSYTRLLREAYRAIHAADPGAQVVAGSLVAPRANYRPGDAMRDLYRAGAKRFFDAVGVHPFTNDPTSVGKTIDQMLQLVQPVRGAMRQRGDGRKPILLTEMTWPASVGKVPRRALLGLETTSRGQVLRVKAAYRRLAQLRRRLNITQAYWYSWATQYNRNGALTVMTFRYAGLTRLRKGVFSRMPILGTYSRLARKYEGCRKSSDARRCGG